MIRLKIRSLTSSYFILLIDWNYQLLWECVSATLSGVVFDLCIGINWLTPILPGWILICPGENIVAQILLLIDFLIDPVLLLNIGPGWIRTHEYK